MNYKYSSEVELQDLGSNNKDKKDRDEQVNLNSIFYEHQEDERPNKKQHSGQFATINQSNSFLPPITIVKEKQDPVRVSSRILQDLEQEIADSQEEEKKGSNNLFLKTIKNHKSLNSSKNNLIVSDISDREQSANELSEIRKEKKKNKHVNTVPNQEKLLDVYVKKIQDLLQKNEDKAIKALASKIQEEIKYQEYQVTAKRSTVAIKPNQDEGLNGQCQHEESKDDSDSSKRELFKGGSSSTNQGSDAQERKLAFVVFVLYDSKVKEKGVMQKESGPSFNFQVINNDERNEHQGKLILEVSVPANASAEEIKQIATAALRDKAFEYRFCLMIRKSGSEGFDQARLQDKDDKEHYLETTLATGGDIKDKIEKAYINHLLSQNPNLQNWRIKLKHICKASLEVNYIETIEEEITDCQTKVSEAKDTFIKELENKIYEFKKTKEEKKGQLDEYKNSDRRNGDADELLIAKINLEVAQNELAKLQHGRTSILTYTEDEIRTAKTLIMSTSNAKRFNDAELELKELEAILNNAKSTASKYLSENKNTSLAYVHNGDKRSFESLKTGCCAVLYYSLCCCKKENRRYWKGGLGLYLGVVSALALIGGVVWIDDYHKNNGVFPGQNLNCYDKNLGKKIKSGESLIAYYVKSKQQMLWEYRCDDGNLKDISNGIYNPTKNDCFENADGYYPDPMEANLKDGERNESALIQCVNGQEKDLYRFNCEGESNVSGQPQVNQVKFKSSLSKALTNARNKDIQMNWTSPVYLPVSQVQIDGTLYKILLGSKLTEADIQKQIIVSYEEVNTNNSNYTQSLNCSLSQNTCDSNPSYLVTPIETPISVRINDTMIYKHQKENDVNDVALINGTYRIVYAVPVVTNGNQTISLYDTFESLGWIELNSSMRSPLQVENDLRQKIEKITTEASFKYDKRTGRLTFNGDFPSNLVISGVGIIQQDIEKQFNQELFGVEVASGSYAEFYQNFITERDGFACDEIFTQEQIQAIITKAIEVKIADAKSTTAKTTTAKTKVNPNAVDIVSLFRKDTREAISFDTWRNQTLSNLNVIMSSPFKPFTLFNVPDDQEINTTCIAEESKRGLSVKNIDPRYNDRYQEQGLALLLRQTIKNLYTNRGRGLEGDESQQAFKEVGKNGKHNGNHNGFLQGEDDEETLIEPKNKKLLKKQIKGRGGRGW